MKFSSTKSSPLLLLAALKPEAAVAHSLFSFTKIRTEKQYKLFSSIDEKIFLLQTGIGHQYQPEIMKEWIGSLSPALMINYGICGALHSDIPLDQVFVITAVTHVGGKDIPLTDPDSLGLSRKLSFLHSPLLTADSPVTEKGEREKLYYETKQPLVDMEGYFLARIGKELSLPLIMLKYTTDLADDNSEDQIGKKQRRWQTALCNVLEKLIRSLP